MGGMQDRQAGVRASQGLRLVAALLLLLAIAADLASDSRCHPPGTLEATASVWASEPSDDPCADGCVPDCYLS
jgi:hypothetical protein